MFEVEKMNRPKNKWFSFLVIMLGMFFSRLVFADDSLGGVAQNMMQPVTLFNNLVDTACFVIGGAFLFATIIKYFEHRRSPLMVPISTVIFLLIAGLILVGLPFLSYGVSYGVKYSFFR